MTEAHVSELKRAVEQQHGGIALFSQTVPIKEMHGELTVWDGVVTVFDLEGHPEANRAYAWSYELDDGRRRFIAVLQLGPIKGPRDAVRAAIVAEHKGEKK